MSNYPPGVTGREWQIAGPDYEGPMMRRCEADDVRWVAAVVVTSRMQEIQRLTEMRKDALRPDYFDTEIARQVAALLEPPDEQVTEGPCEWEGEVDVQVYGTTATWDCPRCGTTHEDELDDGS